MLNQMKTRLPRKQGGRVSYFDLLRVLDVIDGFHFFIGNLTSCEPVVNDLFCPNHASRMRLASRERAITYPAINRIAGAVKHLGNIENGIELADRHFVAYIG